MDYAILILFNITCLSILITTSIASVEHVAIIKYTDVKVYNDTQSLNVIEILPLGSYIIYTAQRDQLEFLRIAFPINGYILSTTVYLVSDQLISDLPLWVYTYIYVYLYIYIYIYIYTYIYIYINIYI
jgi:hypothetical protein